MTIATPPVRDVSLDAKVAFLRQPSSFTDPAYRVEAIETHMSWVFLTDGYVYKLKKPVCYEFLDFRTVEARRYYCEEEVRLNRRLAPDVYLGTVALSVAGPGHLQLGGNGSAIDWLVKMRRLPLHSMLDYAILHGGAERDIVRVAQRLAAFYGSCAPEALDPAQYRANLEARQRRSLDELALPAYALDAGQLARIRRAQQVAARRLAGVLDARVHAGHIVEGHGDLRPEHVCLQDGVPIIDCLEFSRELRLLDSADELAFLALECERLGASASAALLLSAYGDAGGDLPQPALLHFYQSYRACLRATIAVRHLQERKFRYSPQWLARANAYLLLAERHAPTCR